MRNKNKQDGGYNITGALEYFNVVETPSPGMPYKLRKRMVRELGGSDCLGLEARSWARTSSATSPGLFRTAALYAGTLAMWLAVWWYAGVQYGK